MLEEPQNLEVKETKIERLEQVIDDLMNRLTNGDQVISPEFHKSIPIIHG